MTDSSYFQDIVSALEKALYYERGRGGYFRATMVGTDFIDRVKIKGETSEEVIKSCVDVLMENKMIEKASSKKDDSGTFFTFEIEGCVHLPVEARLKEEGVPAFVCPPINMILYKIRELAGLAVEIADITVNQEEGRCTVRVVIFKQE
ncbi:MAG: hypothetical protein JSW56_12550 [Deltaproteobacteria bacterium]|nr:MAG: hypothetical protein JSW56_12550 [Deltaproteobacteria bacterium]